jgi:F-type H+-transporting ATPase subunit epsilon
MMADMVAFELVSPERLLLSVSAEMVVVPGSEGDFAVLAGHAPMLSTLRPGAIEIYEGDKVTERIFVGGGFAEVSNDRLTVLAEEAMPFADIDRAKLEQSLKDATEDLEDAKSDEARYIAQQRVDHLQQVIEAL